MNILAPARSRVKSAPSPVMTDRQFSAWCRDQVRDLDWSEALDLDAPYEPSVADDYQETGYGIGSTGDSPALQNVFGHHSRATRREGAQGFRLGLVQGRKVHAYRVGHDLGIAGQADDRPATVPSRFAPEFLQGWRAGADQWADRVAIMAEWATEPETQDRWHEAEIAEAGAWFRDARLDPSLVA